MNALRGRSAMIALVLRIHGMRLNGSLLFDELSEFRGDIIVRDSIKLSPDYTL